MIAPLFGVADPVALSLTLVIIAAAVTAIYRRVDVRLTLFIAAMLIGSLAGEPVTIIRTFFATFANEKFVVPICSAMGFAYVLRHTECDKHLVHLLVRPLTHVRFLLIPGTVVVGFLVNMPIISQTSTVVVLGAVVIPILLAARFSPITIAATLVLGCSIGGELLNPGAPELRTIVTETKAAAELMGREPLVTESHQVVQRILPLNLLGLLVGTLVFWLISLRAESRHRPAAEAPERAAGGSPVSNESNADEPAFRVNYLKAVVPLIPLLLLYLAAPPFRIIPTEGWLSLGDDDATTGQHDTRLIALAMLIGVVVATLVVPRSTLGVARAFFDGAGYGFANIVSLIVTATCFGKAIELIGIAALIGQAIENTPGVLIPMAGGSSLAFAVLSGSGMATTQSLFGFFAKPAMLLGIDPVHVGAVVALASAAGRTMSPVAAVVLMTAALTQTEPMQIVKRVALPLLASMLVIVIVAIIWAPAY